MLRLGAMGKEAFYREERPGVEVADAPQGLTLGRTEAWVDGGMGERGLVDRGAGVARGVPRSVGMCVGVCALEDDDDDKPVSWQTSVSARVLYSTSTVASRQEPHRTGHSQFWSVDTLGQDENFKFIAI